MSAGGGSRLSLDAVSEAVASWFKDEAPLPTEWNGKSLQTLVCYNDYIETSFIIVDT